MSRDKVGSVGVDTGRDSAQSCPWGVLTDGLGDTEREGQVMTWRCDPGW